MANYKHLDSSDVDAFALGYRATKFQAIAIKFDPGSCFWIEFLHTEMESLFTSVGAVLSLLQMTEVGST